MIKSRYLYINFATGDIEEAYILFIVTKSWYKLIKIIEILFNLFY